MMPITASRFRRTLIASAAALAMLPVLSPTAQAQTVGGPSQRLSPLVPPMDVPQIFRSERYAAGAQVGRIQVEVARNGVPADGQTAVAVRVNLRGANDQPLASPVMVTLEVSGGRIQLPGAQTDELGPGKLDADPVMPGVQVRVEGGSLSFNLLAPDKPQDVVMRVTAGRTEAAGVITFVPELREMLAVGVVEGVIRLSRRDPSLIQPVRVEDGFEAELRRFSRSFSDGRGDVAGRAAFYLKGKISGSALLTASFDSEKETRARLLRDIRPDEFYPVYGDSAIRTYDAQSSSRLYVRIDQDRSYVLFGDFATTDGLNPAFAGGGGAGIGGGGGGSGVNGTGLVPPTLRTLGAYSRTLTGLQGSWSPGQASDDPAAAVVPRGPAAFGRLPGGVKLGGFAAYDSLKQVTEEFRGTGTSGPFVLRNNSALENSEKIELVVRDKDNPSFVKASRLLQRFEDYNFEPFSGRILLTRPLPSTDVDGDPQSLRITYEVDQGGEKFWIWGVEGSVQFGDNLRLGAALIDDRNPASPYRLGSVHAGVQLGQGTWLTAELAQSDAVLYGVPAGTGSLLYTNPTLIAGEQRLDREGRAARVALQHSGESISLQASFARTGAGFYNPSSGWLGGRREASVKGGLRLTESLRLFGEALVSDDTVSGGERRGALGGIGLQLTERLNVQAGLRLARENAAWNGSVTSVIPNATLGSVSQPTGGFFGGIDPLAIDPVTGQSVTQFAPIGGTGLTPGQGISIDATTAFLGARLQATDQIALQALVEGSVNGDDKHRLMLGGAYQLGERSRLLARYERQSGVTSAYGAARSDLFSIGADTAYMPGGQLFSELRLRDAVEREAQWANGVRNSWMLAEGLMLGTGFEYLRVIDGLGGDAAAASFGLDYTADPLWKLSTRLEGRRVFDADRTPGNDQSDSLLATVTVARKLDRDWTALVRNFALATRFAQRPGLPGTTGYDALQNRFQIGVAYRPVDTNHLDVLSKIEHKYSRNAGSLPGVTEQALIGSLHAIYHPSRPWWLSGRLAGKSAREEGISAFGATRYNAALLSGRLVYDITENIDLGLMAAGLFGSGNTRQQAIGLEAGYLVQQNLWLSVGFNARGFFDRDLSGAEYTNSGLYLRLRFKFDEDLFTGTSRTVNRSLDRAPGGGN
jgi:hypothetical protein